MNKKGIGILLAMVLLVIAGVVFGYVQHKDKEIQFSSTEYAYNPESNFYLAKDGLYYVQDEIAQYYDMESKRKIKLGSNDGDAYYKQPVGILFYNNTFYCISADFDAAKNGIPKNTLYQCDCDGNNRKKLYEFPTGGVESMYVYNGKLYYTFFNDILKNEDHEEEWNGSLKSINSLRVFDLKTKKEKILYEYRQTGEQRNGSLQICPSDNRDKIYCLYRYYDGDQEDRDAEDYLPKFFRSEFLCYDLKSKKMEKCFTQLDKSSFVAKGCIYHDYLYCTRIDYTTKEDDMILERYPADGGKKEELIKYGEHGYAALFENIFFIYNDTSNVLYDVKQDMCYRKTSKDMLRVSAFSSDGKMVALDDGDYSDLKKGDTYTKSRFVPKVITMDEFLTAFEPFEGGNFQGVQYTPVKN
ncbi:hypothetical protein [[Clostridium] polysaccharolyticum]|uniref:DUF5050 domain-containing protein n=1 Tax=[Clostridium] polysaccharolyticum TaxID=29364 RepID=A0A1I0DE01_9FIRM|nr:hypothetical protein [[Clostridium] polysaccharolyticum]SET30587.1 hypothetical protein SAMN04487772_11428 [[Clostridium] polysaccharolyticum]